MPNQIFAEASIDELVGAEVALEREFNVPDLEIASLIELAGKHDMPVALVSDTYFSDEQVRFLLDRPELEGLKSAPLFRSQQYGVGKGSGLWPIVLRELQLAAKELIHVGDHKLADIAVPAKLGVRTVHYVRLDADFSLVLNREQEPIGESDPVTSLLDHKDGDFGVTSLRAKAVLSKIPRSSPGAAQAWRYGAGVLGPVLTGFAEWVAEKAHREGIPVIWCPMREGEMLSALVNNAARARGWDVEAKPIWLSRHVVAVATMNPFDADDVLDFVRRQYRPTVRRLLGTLDLRPGDVPSLAGKLGTIVDSEPLRQQVVDTIMGSKHLQNRLAVSTTRARERLLTSMRRCGALEDERLVLVDLGWGGTIQGLLAKTLDQAGLRISPIGWYLVTTARSVGIMREGLRVEGYLACGGHPREISATVTRSPEVVEQIVNSLCGSLIGFDENAEPVLGPFSEGAGQQAERLAAREGILRFQDLWNGYVGAAGGTWPTLLDGARPRLANILASAIALPTAREASLFGAWQHEENLGSDVITPLLGTELLTALPHLSPNDLDDLNMREAFWPALAAASDPQLAAAAQAVQTGHVEPAAFEQSASSPAARVRYRTAAGEWEDGARRRVRINHDGLSFLKATVPGRATTAISLALPGRRAIVRIDWIEARPAAGGSVRTKALRWETPEELAGLERVGVSALGGNLFEFNGATSALVVPLEAFAGRGVLEVRVTAGFAMLPHRAPLIGRRPRPQPPKPKPKPVAEDLPLTRRARRIEKAYRDRGAAGVAAVAARFVDRRLRRRA